jgi:hypothetical protein
VSGSSERTGRLTPVDSPSVGGGTATLGEGVQADPAVPPFPTVLDATGLLLYFFIARSARKR